MNYIPAIDEVFPREAEAIEDLVTRTAERVEREKAKLLRPDGSPVYALQEHAERVRVIEEAAATEFTAAGQRYVDQAAREREQAEAELATLNGADGWETLSESERQTAATRREFVREDVERLAPAEVERRARASLAAKDKVAVWLFACYIRPRVEGGQGARLAGVLAAFDATFGDPSERHWKRLALERRIEATKSLRGRVEDGRRRVDGTRERQFAGMRVRYSA